MKQLANQKKYVFVMAVSQCGINVSGEEIKIVIFGTYIPKCWCSLVGQFTVGKDEKLFGS